MKTSDGSDSLSREEFVRNLTDSKLLSAEEFGRAVMALAASTAGGEALAEPLVAAGLLTPYQVKTICLRRFHELRVGNYDVLDRLGAGGMGTVFKARHRRMKRVVALKVLAPELCRDESYVQRFQREVETIARLNHPNIVMAHDADESEIGHFLVMEYIDGYDLATLVKNQGPLGLGAVVTCILHAARGLGYAHTHGLVHRDVKPANLLWDRHGGVKVTDLGLARPSSLLAASAHGHGDVTMVGDVLGTVDYMSPEQAIDSTQIDHRADIYSLGCTLFFLCTGKPPYSGETLMATVFQHREAPIPDLAPQRQDLPRALGNLFRKMLAKDRIDRHATMAEVVSALEAICDTLSLDPGIGQLSRVQFPSSPGSNASSTITDAPPAQMPEEKTILVRQPARSSTAADARSTGHPSPAAEINTFMMRRPGRSPGEPSLESQRPPDQVPTARTMGPRTAATTDAPTLVTPPDRSRSRVLIVDDSKFERYHIRGVLANLGFAHFAEAGNGVEALAAVARETFDLIVTDCNMPGMDGAELVSQLRQTPTTASIPIIMVSTEEDPTRLEAIYRLGVTAICDKSFNLEMIRKIVHQLRI